MSRICQLKQILRRAYKSKRKDFVERTSLDKLHHLEKGISEHVNRVLLSELRAEKEKSQLILGIYSPLNYEINAYNILQGVSSCNYKITLPCIEDETKEKRLIFRKFDGKDKLIAGKWNIRQPSHTAERCTPDVLIVPLLAFDRELNRLGYGQGYYDMTISALRNDADLLTIGVAFEFQKHEHRLPKEQHDVPLDYVITERQVYSQQSKQRILPFDKAFAL